MIDILNRNIIKMVKTQIIAGIVIILNNSINEGTFPCPKKNDEFVTVNYRPRSLLNVFHKLLEKLMYKRRKSLLEKQNILYKYHSGLRTNHSSSHALIDVLAYI